MEAERAEAITGAALNVLYALALVAMLLAAMPGPRLALIMAWRRQLHAWRYGQWLGGQRRSKRAPPSWTRELERDQLEAEPGWWW